MAWFQRRRRYKREPLLKYIYLTDSEVAYRLAQQADLASDRLERYYEEVRALRDEQRKDGITYLVILSAAVLTVFNGIQEFSAGGITVSTQILKHLLLIAWPWSQCSLGVVHSKYGFVSSIFREHFSKLDAPAKVDFLARYPQALGFDNYYVERFAALPYLIRLKFPLKMAAFAVLLAFGLVAYICFLVWLYVSLCSSVLESSSAIPLFWSYALVAASGAIMLFSFLLPSNSPLKKRYTHMGLIHVLNSSMNRDRLRYAHFAHLIDAANKRAGR